MALRRWGSETEMNLSAGSALSQRGRPSKLEMSANKFSKFLYGGQFIISAHLITEPISV